MGQVDKPTRFSLIAASLNAQEHRSRITGTTSTSNGVICVPSLLT
jgi:hypothetical protein